MSLVLGNYSSKLTSWCAASAIVSPSHRMQLKWRRSRGKAMAQTMQEGRRNGQSATAHTFMHTNHPPGRVLGTGDLGAVAAGREVSDTYP